MEKGDRGTKRDEGGTPAPDTLQQRVIAFAETLGRIAGTVQARAEGWMDPEALRQQVTAVRDAAAELLKHLRAPSGSPKPKNPDEGASAGSTADRTRSGGVVDAPGKKHRKPAASEPDASPVSSQAAKMRSARMIEKGTPRRGRG